jgi:hypothetical protein
MSWTKGTSKRLMVIGGGAMLVAVTTYVTAVSGQPQPPTKPPGEIRPLTTITVRSLKQPIGQPRIQLDPRLIPRLTPQLPGVCAAPVDVNIRVNPAGPGENDAAAGAGGAARGLSMNMRTEEKAVWYSLVDTIPPIGHTASITVKPVRLLEGERKVGTLLAGEVKFREVVRDIPLAGTDAQNSATVRRLLAEMSSMPKAMLAKLAPISLPEYTLPPAGIQVMRARLEETYEIDGIGKDTVQLNGWIAVRHGTPRPIKGATEVTWETAVLDTEFVGMHLEGDSDLFGNVLVTLDTKRPSFGQVGRIEIPELARFALLAKLKKDTVADAAPAGSATPGSQPQQ